MKNLILSFVFLLCVNYFHAQDVLQKPQGKNRLFIHYYPSSLIVGDISFGIEHIYKKRLAQEVSFNIKSFPTKIYYYDKGFRLDYLLKYILFEDNEFRFSANLSFMYKDIYFRNKNINYYYIKFDSSPGRTDIYQILNENRRLTQYGMGVGFSLNYKLNKHFFIGTDVAVNVIKNKTTYNYNEIIYRDIYATPNPYFTVPSMYVLQRINLSPLLRFKISFLFGKK